jgi:hypothetical protein
MFKCWIYISGAEQNSHCSAEQVSEKTEVYNKSNKEAESKKIDSYIPGMRRFGFFDRFINFS